MPHYRTTSEVLVHSQRGSQYIFVPLKSHQDSSSRKTYESKPREWKATELAHANKEDGADAVDASRAVLKRKIAEQMAPLLPGFLAKYNPADARFIGSPIDYLIFRNMSKGDDSEEPIETVLLDVKTGKSGLNDVQKRIEEAAADKRISFDVLRINETATAGTNSAEADTQLSKMLSP